MLILSTPQGLFSAFLRGLNLYHYASGRRWRGFAPLQTSPQGIFAKMKGPWFSPADQPVRLSRMAVRSAYSPGATRGKQMRFRRFWATGSV